MFINKVNTFIIIILNIFTMTFKADEILIDNFINKNEKDWEFISDQVMGGVSFGDYKIISEQNVNFIRLTGFVSLENNGGFIQVRKKINNLTDKKIKGIKFKCKGNNTDYFIHIRTNFTLLPWQYYQAKFFVNSNWQDIQIDLSNFSGSGILLPKTIKPKHIKSIAIVAFGKKHRVNLDVSDIAFY